jgi:hypothetical protein
MVSAPQISRGRDSFAVHCSRVRRDILIVSAARIDERIITGRVRTTNLLYASHGLVPQPEFEPARELHIDQMWHWTGKSWGGLPDGTSIMDHLPGGRAD